MDEQLHHEITSILSQLVLASKAEAEQPSMATEDSAHGDEQAASPQPPPPIIVYLVDPPPLEVYDGSDRDYSPDLSAGTVESLPETEEQDPLTSTVDEKKTEGPAAPESLPPRHEQTHQSTPRRPRQASKRGMLVGVLSLLLAGAALAAFLLAPSTVSATVTIIPQARAISTTTTLSVVTNGTVNPLLRAVPGRLLSSLNLSQAQTVSTTGTGHQAAQAAQGSITFYNALPAVQTIAAGTLLMGEDGVEVVTDQDAVLSAASPPIEGEVSVPAHALLVGPLGNIATRDINTACCRAGVFASNHAFTGGQDARSFPMVSQRDLYGTVSLLKASLLQSVEAAFQAQVRPTETLIAPRCTPQVTSDHQVGAESTRLSVTVNETCTASVYATEALHDLVKEVTTQASLKQLGTGYTLSGDVQATVVTSTVTDQRQGTLLLRVKGAGIYSSQFTDAQLHQMARFIAGKSKQQASQLLLHLPGVSQVAMTISGGGSSLPVDASAIHVLVLDQTD